MLRLSRLPYRSAVLAVALAAACASAQAEVVVIVSAKSPATTLSTDQISDLFFGRTVTLPGIGQATALDQPEGSSTREQFYQKGLGKTAAQVKAYWTKQIFTGKGRPPREAADDAAVKAQVAADPGLIGYIDKNSLDASVKPLLSIK